MFEIGENLAFHHETLENRIGVHSALDEFDGDGKSDISIYRQGIWWYLQSTTGEARNAQFGQAGDVPTVGDYDGDDKSDIAVFLPANGTW